MHHRQEWYHHEPPTGSRPFEHPTYAAVEYGSLYLLPVTKRVSWRLLSLNVDWSTCRVEDSDMRLCGTLRYSILSNRTVHLSDSRSSYATNVRPFSPTR